MKVIVNNNTYQMSDKQFKNLLTMAKASVKKGIISIVKNNIAEMRRDTFTSNSEFKRKVKEFESLGYKVYTSK